ncbi:MAG: histone deacetylase [Oscillatoriaceae cyanobacterium Prado104]|jgi:acetoin utilization deacetylase AcuC-like enzyme|nr:histone deacetylase [Oscillatoriaceae cyanobacterium Prado104]
MMPAFATYLYPHTCITTKPLDRIKFIGHSLPHFNQVREQLAKHLNDYPQLPLRKAEGNEYLRVHSRAYLKKLLLKAQNQPLDETSLALPANGGECEGLEFSLPGYLYGLGGMLEAIDLMQRGVLERAYCFSLVGHHAHREWGHGYCLLNPQAAAARYAQTLGFNKILIVDWDIHHGDGTQSIFSGDSNIYCISIHSAVDLYMAKASDLKAGTTTTAESVGHCNIPLLSETFPEAVLTKLGITGNFYRSCESLIAFEEALTQVPWHPHLILIFSGYDSHRDDCGKEITDWGDREFQHLTRLVLELAQKANCPVLSCHGGGYQLPITVSAAISHIKVLAS